MSQANDIDRINSYFKAREADPKAANVLSQSIIRDWHNWYRKLGFLAKSLSADALITAQKMKDTLAYSMGDASTFGADSVHQTFTLEQTAIPKNYNNTTVLGVGSTGPYVVSWQKIIGVTADGQFGPATKKATQTWQSQHGLTPDGVVGPQTWAAASGTVPAATLTDIQHSEQVATGTPQPFSGMVGLTPSGNIDLGDVDAPGFLLPPTVVQAPVAQASLIDKLTNLSTPVKIGLAAAGAFGIWKAPKQYGGFGK